MSGPVQDETRAWVRTLTQGRIGGYGLAVVRTGRTGRPPARPGRLREGLHSSCGKAQHGRASPRSLLHWPSSRQDCRQAARSPRRRHQLPWSRRAPAKMARQAPGQTPGTRRPATVNGTITAMAVMPPPGKRAKAAQRRPRLQRDLHDRSRGRERRSILGSHLFVLSTFHGERGHR